MAPRAHGPGGGASRRVAERASTTSERPLRLVRRRTGGAAAKRVAADPVRVDDPAIARCALARAWCEHLDRFGDLGGRLQRGREYLLAGAVTDLRVEPGRLSGQVRGTRPYTQTIVVQPLPEAWRDALRRMLARGELRDASQCRLPDALREALRSGRGVFPGPEELATACTCPDRASLCKHVVAVLYGFATRLDRDPLLLFRLRGVELDASPPASPSDEPVPLAVAARVRRSWLRSIGVPASTIDGWLRRGVLLPTRQRGVYLRTFAANRKLAGYRAGR